MYPQAVFTFYENITSTRGKPEITCWSFVLLFYLTNKAENNVGGFCERGRKNELKSKLNFLIQFLEF